MHIYETSITVKSEDLDELNHVNNVRYVKWVNDIAKEHWLKKASKEILESHFWVLIRHNIEYKSSVVLDDIIQLKTFVTKSEGVTSTRMVHMYHKDSDKPIAISETVWCLMDVNTKRPTRISQEIAKLFN